MHRNFRYRLFTNANQERELSTMLETHRRLYNTFLDIREMVWEFHRQNFSAMAASKWFKNQRAVNPFFARLNFTSATQTMRRLDKAFNGFFRRVEAGEKPGYPRFKWRDQFNSFTFTYLSKGKADGCRLLGNRLRVQHVGTIRVKLHRPIEGKIKTATLKREAGKWYVIFSCELPDVPITSTLPPVGIDMGLESFLTTSEGESEPNPRYLKNALPELRRANRSLARKKKKGGSNRCKARQKLAKIHARVRNLRREHHHQVACRLTSRYGFIAAESLRIDNMLENRKLSRAIHDAAWGGFLAILHCKAEKAGAQFVEVDPCGTSQECSQCAQIVSKDLSVRQHDCPHCGLSIHRDINAARNILARARQVRIAPAEVNVAH